MSIGLIVLLLTWVVGGSILVCKVLCPIDSEVSTERVMYEKPIEQTIQTRHRMYNENLNSYKDVHEGFSWTVLLFGFFPALFRGDWKWGAIMFLCSWAFWFPAAIFFSFKYNDFYMKDLYDKGYRKI